MGVGKKRSRIVAPGPSCEPSPPAEDHVQEASNAPASSILVHLFYPARFSGWNRGLLFRPTPCLLRVDVHNKDFRAKAKCESSSGELTTRPKSSESRFAMWLYASIWP